MGKHLIGNIGKKFINPEEDKDVRILLVKSLQVGASVAEACAYAGVPLMVYGDWEYTYNEINIIKEFMYAHRIDSINNINLDTNNKYDVESSGINIELLTRMKKNPTFGQDVYNLIEKCKKAQAEVIIYHLSNIHSPKKAKGLDWKASAWYLERTNPSRYGRREAEIVTDCEDLNPLIHLLKEEENGDSND